MKVKDVLIFFKISSEDITEIKDLSDDSSFNSSSWIYINVSRSENSSKYINEALENNAYLVLSSNKNPKVIYIENLEENLNSLIYYFYSFKRKFKLIGITGTNGKSSLSNFLKQSLKKKYKVRNITTIKEKDSFQNELTTPKCFDLYKIFKSANNLNLDYLIMEVSSIGIAKFRVNDIIFDYIFLTNLYVDHLDFHKSIKNYHNIKINFIKGQTQALKFIPYDLNNKFKKDKNVKIVNYKIENNELFIENQKIKTNLVYRTNLINLAYCYYFLKQINELDINVLSNIHPFKGRLDVVNKNPLIIIDYAHSASSFENVVRETKVIFNRKMILIFGSGGDRDKSKRKEYGKIANKYASKIILTNDNPRSEDPKKIIEDISKEIKEYEVILDRKKAIKRGIELLTDDYLLLILGKGNEDFIQFKDYKVYSNDYVEVEKCLKTLMY